MGITLGVPNSVITIPTTSIVIAKTIAMIRANDITGIFLIYFIPTIKNFTFFF
jgi:hypothetical protein